MQTTNEIAPARLVKKAWRARLNPDRLGPIQWLILSGFVLILAIAIGTAAVANHFRTRAIESSQRELANTVLLVTRHFDQQLGDLQGVQNDIVSFMLSAGITTNEAYKSQMSSLDVHQMLRIKLSALPYVGGINLFDSNGWLVNSSETWPVPDINVADRPHFKAIKALTGAPSLVVEPVISRITGAWTAVFSRKLIGTNGEFLGIVSRGVEPSHFENFFASLALQTGEVLTMMHRNGTVLARYPRSDVIVGQNMSGNEVFQRLSSTVEGAASGRYSNPIDGEDRLGSARQLTSYPILIVATTSTEAALADWREQTRYQIAGASISAIGICVILFLIVRQLTMQHRQAQQSLARKSLYLDTAINNMTQGLLLFDASAHLVVCNRRYIEMFKLSPDVIKPGCHLLDLLRHRQETGTFVGDVEDYCATFLKNVASGIINDAILSTPDGRSIKIVYQKSADGGWTSTLEDITERRRSEERISHLAHYDSLTDLPNRLLFRTRVETEFAAIQSGAGFAVLYIDIDEFKGINDSLGHAIGDELLKAVATRLRQCIKDTDLVARLGGDEFAIVQSGIDGHSDVIATVERIYEAIRRPFDFAGTQIITDASIGVAMAPRDGVDLDQLLKHADLAMYGAKASGRRTYRFFEAGMDEGARARRALEADLRIAIKEQAFELQYQPLVDLVTNKVTGCEALLRWRHRERGMVSPAEFIPVAEETGLINELGEWVLKAACHEAATWPDDVTIAVNVSPVQFKTNTLALKVAAALAASGLPARRLELEITEAVLIRDDDQALAALHQLRRLGVRIALDDFGTGYSSLGYLQRFPFDKIKIDRSFVNDLASVGGSSSIIQAVVNIATSRNMITTAEGVETEQQRDLLRSIGCTQMQGYLFSPAKPAADLRLLLRSPQSSAADVQHDGSPLRDVS